MLAAFTLLAQGAFGARKLHGPELEDVKITPHHVVGGSATAVSGKVVLEKVAPAGGLIVNLASSDTSIATVPASVTVAAGSDNAVFAISTFAVQKEKEVRIKATLGSRHCSESLEVTPFEVKGFSFDPSTIRGGTIFTGFQTTAGTITLNAPAGPSGVVIQLESKPSGTSAGSSITVPAGQTTISFAIIAQAVQTTTKVKFTATVGQSHKSTVLTVTP